MALFRKKAWSYLYNWFLSVTGSTIMTHCILTAMKQCGPGYPAGAHVWLEGLIADNRLRTTYEQQAYLKPAETKAVGVRS